MVSQMTPEQAEAYLQRSRRERLIDYMIGGAMICIIFAIGLILVPFIPVALWPSPVKISNLQMITPMPVCPGDLLTFDIDIDVLKPSIIGYWSAVQDNDANRRAYAHTREEHAALVRSIPVKWTARNHRLVPDLAPGDYVLVYGYAALNSDTVPEFVEIPFTVGADCPKED